MIILVAHSLLSQVTFVIIFWSFQGYSNNRKTENHKGAKKGISTVMLVSLLAGVAGAIFLVVVTAVLVKRCRSTGKGEYSPEKRIEFITFLIFRYLISTFLTGSPYTGYQRRNLLFLLVRKLNVMPSAMALKSFCCEAKVLSIMVAKKKQRLPKLII